MISYISIGNSDDKLTQSEWSHFVAEVRDAIREHATMIHGEWFSHSDSPWQNACWCAEFTSSPAVALRERLTLAARKWRQDSIAWADVSRTDFLG